MKRSKILMGLTYYLPNISGVTQYAVILAEELVKRNYKLEVVCGGNDRIINKVKINGINGFNLGKGYIMPGYFIRTYRFVKNADIVLCHLPSIESFWLALYAKMLSKKLIVTHHCEFNFTGTISNIAISVVSYLIHLFVYQMADKIVSYTEDYANTSIFLKHFKNKIVYILPPIKISPTPLFNKRGKSVSATKVVGFVGRIGWEKGLQYLIEAMENVDAKLELVGPYKEVVGDNTYNKIKDNPNIIFHGPEDHEKLNKYYERFDCLVLPSTNNLETFGIVQAEAMVCGTPVVASNLPGVRMPIRLTGMGEICKIADSKDLANKINVVLKNGKQYYQDIAKDLSNFNYLIAVSKYESLFKKLLSK